MSADENTLGSPMLSLIFENGLIPRNRMVSWKRHFPQIFALHLESTSNLGQEIKTKETPEHHTECTIIENMYRMETNAGVLIPKRRVLIKQQPKNNYRATASECKRKKPQHDKKNYNQCLKSDGKAHEQHIVSVKDFWIFFLNRLEAIGQIES